MTKRTTDNLNRADERAEALKAWRAYFAATKTRDTRQGVLWEKTTALAVDDVDATMAEINGLYEELLQGRPQKKVKGSSTFRQYRRIIEVLMRKGGIDAATLQSMTLSDARKLRAVLEPKEIDKAAEVERLANKLGMSLHELSIFAMQLSDNQEQAAPVKKAA